MSIKKKQIAKKKKKTWILIIKSINRKLVGISNVFAVILIIFQYNKTHIIQNIRTKTQSKKNQINPLTSSLMLNYLSKAFMFLFYITIK
jgi:hypothetical protein